MAAPSGSKTIVIIALCANFAIAVCKFLAYLWTSSSAMLSESIHSLADTSNQGLILLGLARAQRPADARHPFGYSKELYFWSFIVAIVLFSLGAGVAIYEGIKKILHPHPIQNVHINYIVLLTALVIEGFATWKAVKEFNRRRGDKEVWYALRTSKDPALFAIVLEDIAAMAGLTIALIGVFVADHFGIAEADGVASLAIGFVLASVALFMSREIRELLVGEAASPEVRRGLYDLFALEVGADKPIRHINEIRTMHLGPEDILVAASVDFHDGWPSEEVEATTERLETSIRKRFPSVRRLFVEAQSREAHRKIVEAGLAPARERKSDKAEAREKAARTGVASTSDGGPSRKQRKAERKRKKKR